MFTRGLLLGLLLISLLLSGAVFARQGCPGPNDPCPPTDDPGKQPTQPGDPEPQPTQENQDRDGDGVPNYVDSCPDAAGSGFTNGCPVDAATATPNNTFVFPISEDCLLGNSLRANIRKVPATDDAIMGQLNAGEIARGIFRMTNAQEETWYFTDAGGYVRSDVVRTNGNCVQLPQIQPGAALLDVGYGVIDGLEEFPLQRNLNALNVTGGLAISPGGEVIGLMSEADIESLAFLVLMQATADAQNDIKTIMDEIKKLQEKEARELDRMHMTLEAQTQAPRQTGLNQSAEMNATLQAEISGTVLLLRHGTTEDCPMFTKWLDYPSEIIDQLEILTPAEQTAPCTVEILYALGDAARPNPTGDGVRPNPTGDGRVALRLNSILVPVQP